WGKSMNHFFLDVFGSIFGFAHNLVGRWWINTNTHRYFCCELMTDIVENLIHYSFSNHFRLNFPQFKMGCFNDMLLLYRRHTIPEKLCLAKMILKALASLPNLMSLYFFLIVHITILFFRSHFRFPISQRIGKIVHL